MYDIVFYDAARKDYLSLDGSQRILVDKSLKRIKLQGMEAGSPLSRELHECRKLKHKSAGIRVIFKQSDNAIEIIEIIAIGRRSDYDVYNTAVSRLDQY